LARKKGKYPPRIVFFFILLVILLLAYLFLSGYLELRKVAQRLVKMEEENKRLSEKNESLEAEAKALRGDPFYIEKLAREELGMVKKGEIVYEIIAPGAEK
jgi:cell division protein FtsL